MSLSHVDPKLGKKNRFLCKSVQLKWAGIPLELQIVYFGRNTFWLWLGSTCRPQAESQRNLGNLFLAMHASPSNSSSGIDSSAITLADTIGLLQRRSTGATDRFSRRAAERVASLSKKVVFLSIDAICLENLLKISSESSMVSGLHRTFGEQPSECHELENAELSLFVWIVRTLSVQISEVDRCLSREDSAP